MNGGGGWGDDPQNVGHGLQPPGEDPVSKGYGPFNATVWEKLGSVDPWGLPKITAYRTTVSGGQPALCITDGKKYATWRSLTYEAVSYGWSKIKTGYTLAKAIGGGWL